MKKELNFNDFEMKEYYEFVSNLLKVEYIHRSSRQKYTHRLRLVKNVETRLRSFKRLPCLCYFQENL